MEILSSTKQAPGAKMLGTAALDSSEVSLFIFVRVLLESSGRLCPLGLSWGGGRS